MRFAPPTIDLLAYKPAYTARKLLTKELCERHNIVPVSTAGGVLVVAMARPRASLVAELAVFTGMKIDAVRATAADIEHAVRTYYGGAN